MRIYSKGKVVQELPGERGKGSHTNRAIPPSSLFDNSVDDLVSQNEAITDEEFSAARNLFRLFETGWRNRFVLIPNKAATSKIANAASTDRKDQGTTGNSLVGCVERSL